MTEFIDIFDEHGQPLGQMERREAHRRGQWHKVVHIWAWDEEKDGHLYFQQRASGRRIYGGLLDCTAAGHVSAGESVAEALREYPEEMGRILSPEDTVFAGIRAEIDDIDAETLNREFQYVYLTQVRGGVEGFAPDKDAVSAVIRISLPDLADILGQNILRPCVALQLSGDAKEWRVGEVSVSPANFIPTVHGYFLEVQDLLQRVLRGDLTEARKNEGLRYPFR